MIELMAVLCGVGGLFLLATLCRRRVREATAREHARLTHRIAERERIARELHDELLQGMTGLALQLHAAIRRMPSGSPELEALQRVLARTNDTLVAGRDRARELRCGNLVGGALVDALLDLRHELSQQWPSLQIRVLVDGSPRRLAEHVREHALCIGRDAMTHAAEHAQSQSIEVEVHFAPQALVLIVRDDGRGIVPDALEAGTAEGGSGMPDMAEHARRSGGQLQVRTRADGGTEVRLEVPAAVAYVREARRWWPFGPARRP